MKYKTLRKKSSNSENLSKVTEFFFHTAVAVLVTTQVHVQIS